MPRRGVFGCCTAAVPFHTAAEANGVAEPLNHGDVTALRLRCFCLSWKASDTRLKTLSLRRWGTHLPLGL